MAATDFHISTPRLVISHLDPLQDAHCDFLVTLYNTPQSRQYNSVSAPMPDRAAARANIASNEHIRTSGYGRYLVSLKPAAAAAADGSAPAEPDATPSPSEPSSAPTMVGVVSVKFRKFAGAPRAPDVGFGLLPGFQGRGYATEAAGALVAWVEEAKGQREFFGFCDPGNEGSKGVFRRMGFEERGVREVRGVRADGGVLRAEMFCKGLRGELGEYGLG